MSWTHMAHLAQRESEHGNGKLGAILWIVVGLFLSPALVGIPMVGYGIFKLCK